MLPLVIVFIILFVLLAWPLVYCLHQYLTNVYRYLLRYDRPWDRKTPSNKRRDDTSAPKFARRRARDLLQTYGSMAIFLYFILVIPDSNLSMAAIAGLSALYCLGEIALIVILLVKNDHAKFCLEVAERAFDQRDNTAITFDLPEFCDRTIANALSLPVSRIEKCHQTMRSWDRLRYV
jgi:hypothetical protein